jgi:hypothetical protein
MKRFWPWAVAIVAVPLSVPIVYTATNEIRELSFQSALKKYSRELRRGSSRREVEGYLRKHGVAFERCCMTFDERGAFTDLVTIGREYTPWYCDEHLVYIALEFTATEFPHFLETAYDSDALKEVKLSRQAVGCL